MACIVFSTLSRFEQRKRAGRRMGTSLGLMETSNEVACLDSLEVRGLLRYLAEPVVTALALWMEFLMKVKS